MKKDFVLSLTTLELEQGEIDESGAVAFTSLNLSNGNISIGTSAAFGLVYSLPALNLSRNIIGYEGARALSDSLKSNSTLKTLFLSETSLVNQVHVY